MTLPAITQGAGAGGERADGDGGSRQHRSRAESRASARERCLHMHTHLHCIRARASLGRCHPGAGSASRSPESWPRFVSLSASMDVEVDRVGRPPRREYNDVHVLLRLCWLVACQLELVGDDPLFFFVKGPVKIPRNWRHEPAMIRSCLVCTSPHLIQQTPVHRQLWALFSSDFFCKIKIVALSFIFDKYCLIMD
jgi:hypothetical protein